MAEYNDRERATVLAALRYWQRVGLLSADQDIIDIATDGHRFTALGAHEIGELCERINIAGPEPAHVIRYWKARGFDAFNTGGGCVALRHAGTTFDGYILITEAGDTSIPAGLDVPVIVGWYANGSSQATRSAEFQNSAAAWTGIVAAAFAEKVRSSATDEQLAAIRTENTEIGTRYMTEAFREFGWKINTAASFQLEPWTPTARDQEFQLERWDPASTECWDPAVQASQFWLQVWQYANEHLLDKEQS